MDGYGAIYSRQPQQPTHIKADNPAAKDISINKRSGQRAAGEARTQNTNIGTSATIRPFGRGRPVGGKVGGSGFFVQSNRR